MEATLRLFQELKKDYSHNKRYSTFLVLCAFNISTSLPPMWTKFKFRRPRHMWVEFVVGSLLCSERFFSRYSGVPSHFKNQHFQIPFRLGMVGDEPVFGCAASKLVFYLFIYNLRTFRQYGQRPTLPYTESIPNIIGCTTFDAYEYIAI